MVVNNNNKLLCIQKHIESTVKSSIKVSSAILMVITLYNTYTYFLAYICNKFLLPTIQTDQKRKHQSDAMHTFQSLSRGKRLPLRRAKKALQSNMRSLGLTFCNRIIPGDGNCLFHALSDQLKRHQMLRIRHLQLRRRVINYMSKHPYIVSNTQHELFHLGIIKHINYKHSFLE